MVLRAIRLTEPLLFTGDDDPSMEQIAERRLISCQDDQARQSRQSRSTPPGMAQQWIHLDRTDDRPGRDHRDRRRHIGPDELPGRPGQQHAAQQQQQVTRQRRST